MKVNQSNVCGPVLQHDNVHAFRKSPAASVQIRSPCLSGRLEVGDNSEENSEEIHFTCRNLSTEGNCVANGLPSLRELVRGMAEG